MIGQAKGMVARRGGDDPARLLFGAEGLQRVARAAFFEAAGPLQVFELTENLQAGGFRQRDRERARRRDDVTGDALGGVLDVLEGHGHGSGV